MTLNWQRLARTSVTLKIAFTIVGAYLGLIYEGIEGGVLGLVLGFLTGAWLELQSRTRQLEIRIDDLRQRLKALLPAETASTAGETAGTASQAQPEDTVPETSAATGQPVSGPPGPVQTDRPGPAVELPVDVPAQADEPAYSQSGTVDRIRNRVKQFFTTGNVVVKAGVIVLFFGIGFLLKYAIDNNAFPVHYRLGAISIAAAVIFLIGWRLRISRPEYAVSLQGGAIGILYLCGYFAARHYQLVHPQGAFLIMIVLVTLAGVLAWMQNARSLALMGSIGGFLAPVLSAGDEGSHVMLFSYYALLNVGIFGLAWLRVWRILNWTGFVFTFVISTWWGAQYYDPVYFNTVEPFLILFFLFYLAISVLFTYKQPPRLGGFVDASLVFGLPLIAFALQSQLVQGYDYGRAISAFAMASIYLGLSQVLRVKPVAGMQTLSAAFMALAVIFFSLTIPMIFTGHWTAAAWSLQGAGMIWLGLTQHRILARNFGLLLQVGAAVFYLFDASYRPGSTAVFNSAYLGCLSISIGALFSSYFYHRHTGVLHTWERLFHALLLAWGLLWWFAAGGNEIDRHIYGRYELNVMLVFCAVSFLLLDIIARKNNWRPAVYPSLVLLPVLVLVTVYRFVDSSGNNPWSNYGYLCWSIALFCQYLILYRNRGDWPADVRNFWHAGTSLLLLFLFTWGLAEFLQAQHFASQTWHQVVWLLLPAMFVSFIRRAAGFLNWPFDYDEKYRSLALTPVAWYLALALVVFCFNSGDPAPFPYIPVFNPLETAVCLTALAVFTRVFTEIRDYGNGTGTDHRQALLFAVMIASFLSVNSFVARGVHYYGGVHYDFSTMFNSAMFQTGISIVWTLFALTITGMATRNGRRKLWYTGATLISMVVIKLFVIDLADTGTVARIISFITVGILLLVTGYFSPLPPAEEK